MPAPIDTSSITLPDDVLDLVERLSENIHENWAAQRIRDGWSYGTVRDDLKKTHPCLVPYEELPESERDYDRLTVVETLKTLSNLGFEIARSKESYQEGNHL